MNTSQQVRIRNFLVQLAKNGSFYVQTYGSDDLAADIDFGSTSVQTLAPSSVECNEVEETYAVDSKYGRDLKLKREQWAFTLILKFNKEVTLEAFVNSLLSDPPVLPRTDDFAPAFCYLRRKTVTHPPREGSPTGTQAILFFAVNTGRY